MLEEFFVIKAIELTIALIKGLSGLRRDFSAEISELERTFGPLDYLVPYYVVPDSQNVNPADLPEDNTGLVARTNIFKLLNTFLAGNPRFSHAFILSDAGMGKSSLLVMLKLLHLNKLISPQYRVELMKIHSDTIDRIEGIRDPGNTVLLLDALDEDPEAWTHFYTRTQTLLQATRNFRKVIITCRAQFFPREYEEDGRVPGQINLSGFYCSKMFLSPFSDAQVDEYLEARFTDMGERTKAQSIVNQMHSLKFRPMLLSYVDFLIEDTTHFNNSYTVYESLVEEWFRRELRKGAVEDKEVLRDACSTIADHMYKTRQTEVTSEEVMDLCAHIPGVRHLEYMTLEGRSLLHRTSEGNFKFTHYSILEFFVATSLARIPKEIQNTDQVKTFITDLLVYRQLKRAYKLDLSGISAMDKDLRGVTFRDGNLSDAALAGSNLASSVFRNTELSRSDFSRCNLSNVNLEGATVRQADFSEANMSEARLTNLDCSNLKMRKAILSGANVRGSSFSGVDLSSASLGGINPVNISFVGANLRECDISASDLSGTVFREADLIRARLHNSICHGTDFVSARLDFADLADADLKECDFTGSTLSSANLSRAHLSTIKFLSISADHSCFADCIAVRTLFSEAILANTTFTRAEFADASFAKSDISKADFCSVSLKDTDMTGIRTEGTAFEMSTMLRVNLSAALARQAVFTSSKFTSVNCSNGCFRLANFDKSEFRDVDFSAADLNGASLQSCDLAGVKFNETRLEGVSLIGSSIVNCQWTNARYDSHTIWPDGFLPTALGAIGPGAVLHNSQLAKLDLNGADMQNADLRRSSLHEARMREADLSGANLEECDLSGADLTQSILTRARLRKSNLQGASLAGAELKGAGMEGATYE